MRSFLLILILSFFAPLQCFDKSKNFLVTRRDTNEAICITPNDGDFFPFPTFDLDKLQIPRDVGFMHWDWLSEWQLQNYRNVRRIGEIKVLIAGNRPFHFVAGYYGVADVSILASNVSLWMAHKDQTRGRGLLFELDHFNETTKLKDTTLKYCDQNPEVEGANCTIVDYKNGTNHLNDGNHWNHFMILLEEHSTGVEMFEISYRNYKPVVQWTWNNTNISNPLNNFMLIHSTSEDIDVYAKSHQRNAALRSYDLSLDLANNIEMKRNYTKRSSGKLCVRVEWYEKRSINDSNELLEVRNLASGRVQPATNRTLSEDWPPRTFFQWNHLEAGEYEVTLRFDKRQPKEIDLCQDDDSKIRRTWTSTPKAITKCQFYVGGYVFSAGPSSPPDPKLKPIWSLEAWQHVCDRLGIGSNDTEVQIKFCNKKGCNFSKCPHLQRDPAYIFDF